MGGGSAGAAVDLLPKLRCCARSVLATKETFSTFEILFRGIYAFGPPLAENERLMARGALRTRIRLLVLALAGALT